MPCPEDLRRLVIEQNEARTGWQSHDTPEGIAAMIVEENDELIEAVDFDMPAFSVASEIGDIAYLCIRYEYNYGELSDESRYILYWAEKLAEQTGLNIFDCLYIKILRNDMKYPASVINSMPYAEARSTCKQLWATAGGDVAFYQWYAAIFGDKENGARAMETSN